ncbi:MAG: nuclear transport factor 2 family protein [Gammaproteobacteria bacterium]
MEAAPRDDGTEGSVDGRRPPARPEDWPSTFTARLNAGDLDGVVALYESGARFVAPSGETLVGREQVRRVVAGLIDAQVRMQCEIVKAVDAGDVAILYTDFRMRAFEASGATSEIAQQAIEVLRRQADGSWQLLIGDPNGRGGR